MGRALEELQASLRTAIATDPDRLASYQAVLSQAQAIAPRLPLVHRTGSRGRSWSSIFETNRLVASPTKTDYERNAGFERAVYCFLGYPAWPLGTVALVLTPRTQAPDIRFTPFDSGGLAEDGKIFIRGQVPALVPPDERERLFIEHTGRGADLSAFAADFLAAHLHDPLDYVRRGQKQDPDFPPYHGVTSQDLDRRSWTIEVRFPADVALSPDGTELVQIVLAREALYWELPPAYQRLARVAPGTGTPEELASAIVAYMLHHVESTGP